MPRSFLVRTRPSMEAATDPLRGERSHPCISSDTTISLENQFFDLKQPIHSHNGLLQLNQNRTSKRSTEDGHGAEHAKFEWAMITHPAVPRPQHQIPSISSPDRPSSSLLMTSQNSMMVNYPPWFPHGRLPADSRVLFCTDHGCSCFPQRIGERRPTWPLTAPPFLSSHQRRWSMSKDIPQVQIGGIRWKTEEWKAQGRFEGFLRGSESQKAPVNERQPREEEEEWKLTPSVKEIFSTKELSLSNSAKNVCTGWKKTPTNSEKKTLREDSDHFEELVSRFYKKMDDRGKHSRHAQEIKGDSTTEPATVFKAPVPPSQCRNTTKEDDVIGIESASPTKDAPDSDRPYICKECGKGFREPGNLTRHQVTHTSVKSHTCSQCDKSFSRASNLHTHKKIHSSYKPYICDYCGKGFHQKIDKRIHQYTHTGEKPYKCQKCGRGFKQLTHLNYHMRTHSDERMYHCTYCGKGFNQKGNLQAHIYGHTGERPFKCDVCGKGFTLRSTLNTHSRTHAPKKPFVCQYCNKAFYQKNALKTHHIASHPIINGQSIL